MRVFINGLYLLAIWGALFTGFGNMPLYKRYYIADLPGMGWTGNFYTNLYVHMFCGALLLALAIYFALTYLFARAPKAQLTSAGIIRSSILALSLISGVIMAVKNLPTVHFSFELGVIFNFLHMGMAMLFLIIALICTIGGWKWAKTSPHQHPLF